MNKYLPHAYILKRTKSIKELYIQEHKKNKGKPTKEKVMVKHLHKIKWPNSLKIVPSGVANCRNLPFGGRAMRDSRVRVPRKEYARSRHQCLFEENVGKTRKDMVYEF